MLLPPDRGPLSLAVLTSLRTGEPLVEPDDVPRARDASVLHDADVQLTLWVLYELHYRGFEDVVGDREWDTVLLGLRARLEESFEGALREATRETVAAVADEGEVGDQLLRFVAADDGPGVASFLHRQASRDQVLAFLRERAIYHLKESDPHALVLARLEGPAKTALAELLHDEYGAGRPERLHSTLYGDALESCGLDRSYGAYVEEVTPLTFAVNNLMSLLGLHRRLRGAAMGHLATFEASSSVPSRRIAAGIERVGLPDAAAHYFHEHVEADAVHEQLAARDICGAMVAAEPGLRGDVLFGAAACLHLDALAAAAQLRHWQPEVAA